MNNVLLLCNYESLYSGNFISSLIELDNLYKEQFKFLYAFPLEATNRPWYKALQALGKEVIVLDFNKSKIELAENISGLVSKYNINILHSHFCSTLSIELFSIFFNKKNIKVIIHLHSDFSSGKTSLYTKLKDFIAYTLMSGKCSFLSVSTEFVKLNKNKIKYVPNALASSRLFPHIISGKEIREANNIANDDVLCVMFGWSPIIKGVDIAVEAISGCNKASGKNYILGIVCGREINKEKMKTFIKENTSFNGEEKFIRYLEPIEDVFAYHEAADILLSPSRSEGFPYAILEMLSIGGTCVISNISSLNWAKKYETTHYFKSNIIEECAKCVLEITIPIKKNIEVANIVKKDYNIIDWSNRIVDEYKR